MKIVIPGGSGQVGTLLSRAFHGDGHEVVVVLSRQRGHRSVARRLLGRRHVRPCLGEGDWMAATSSSTSRDGASTAAIRPANSRAILESRVLFDTGRRSGDCAGQASASRLAAGEHGHDLRAPARCRERRDHRVSSAEDLTCRTPGRSASTSRAAWERALDEAIVPLTRKIALRSAMTLEPRRGRYLRHAARTRSTGLGGTRRHGQQFVSWIHDEDFVQSIRWLIDHDGSTARSTSRRRIRCRMRRSCACCARRGASRSACPPRAGCWSPARSSCVPRPNSC